MMADVLKHAMECVAQQSEVDQAVITQAISDMLDADFCMARAAE
jgi:hypothetical protein